MNSKVKGEGDRGLPVDGLATPAAQALRGAWHYLPTWDGGFRSEPVVDFIRRYPGTTARLTPLGDAPLLWRCRRTLAVPARFILAGRVCLS